MGESKLAWALRKEFWWPGKVLDEGRIYCFFKYIGLDTKKGFEKDDIVWNPDKERRIKLVQETVSLIKACGSLGTIVLEAYRDAVIQNEKLIDENADLSSLRAALTGKDLDLEEEVEEEEAVSNGIFQVHGPTSGSLENTKNVAGETEGLQPVNATLATPTPQVSTAPRPRSDRIASRLQALVSSSRGKLKLRGGCGDLKELKRNGGINKGRKTDVLCQICGKLLSNNLMLNRHIQAVHEKIRSICVFCDYSDCQCTRKHRLLRHKNP